MNVTRRPTLAVVVTAMALGCADHGDVAGPDAPDVQFDRPSCPGHPSCGDPPPPGGAATVDLTGGVTTAGSQPVVISKDSRNALAGSGGGEDFDIVDELSLLIAAGSPSLADLQGCVTDPPDLVIADPGAVERLIDRLTDAPQSRTFRFHVNRKDPDDMTGHIYQSWFDDGDGRQYRTRVTASAVTSPSADVYVYTGGGIVSWDMSTGEELLCPNGGSVTMTLNR